MQRCLDLMQQILIGYCMKMAQPSVKLDRKTEKLYAMRSMKIVAALHSKKQNRFRIVSLAAFMV